MAQGDMATKGGASGSRDERRPRMGATVWIGFGIVVLFFGAFGGWAALAPLEMTLGMLVYGLLFLMTRNSDVSAGVGVGLMILLMCLRGRPAGLVISMVGMILTIPAKTLWDRPRRTRLRTG